jgi:hypothetical protein
LLPNAYTDWRAKLHSPALVREDAALAADVKVRAARGTLFLARPVDCTCDLCRSLKVAQEVK